MDIEPNKNSEQENIFIQRNRYTHMPAGSLYPHLPTLCEEQHYFFFVLRGSGRICTAK